MANLTQEEKKKWILENCINDNEYDERLIDLSDLDFSDFDGDVLISGMTVKGNLWQTRQKVESNLYQGYQEIKGDLYQNRQIVSGDLWQSEQIVQGSLYQNNEEQKEN